MITVLVVLQSTFHASEPMVMHAYILSCNQEQNLCFKFVLCVAACDTFTKFPAVLSCLPRFKMFGS